MGWQGCPRLKYFLVVFYVCVRVFLFICVFNKVNMFSYLNKVLNLRQKKKAGNTEIIPPEKANQLQLLNIGMQKNK